MSGEKVEEEVEDKIEIPEIPEVKNIQFSTVKIPITLKNAIKMIGSRLKLPIWKVILISVAYYRAAELHHFRIKEKEGKFDFGKIAWYVYKVGSSIGSFRENPSKKNYELLSKTLSQLEDRLNIDTAVLRQAMDVYLKKPNTKNRIILNDGGKYVISQLLGLLVSPPKNEQKNEQDVS